MVKQNRDVVALVDVKAHPRDLRRKRRGMHPKGFNIGIYNLVLAMRLAWTVIADANIRKQLVIYFSVWLLCAAAAAAYTQVYLACLVQGILGLLLLIASIQSPKAP